MTSQLADQAAGRRAVWSAAAAAERTAEPAWLSQTRNSALRWLSEHGFPTRTDEDWRYFDLEPLLSLPFTSADEIGHDLRTIDVDGLAGPGLGGPRLVLVNGRFSPGLSSVPFGLPPGAHLGSLAAEVDGGNFVLRRRWSKPGGGYAHAFDALNTALASDGAYIELAPETVVDDPIEIVYLTVAEGNLPLVNSRSVISARAGSTATIVETHLGVGVGHSLTNTHTRVFLAPSADIELYHFQTEGREAFHLSTLDVRAGGASSFASRTVSVGALLARHEVRAELTYPSAEVCLDGLYLPAGDQCHDNPVLVDHAAPGCTSRQLYKGIVSGTGHGIFNGHVIVRPGAAGSEAHQTNKNLLLSDRAEVDTRPRLEIFADEVSATHGAAVGQLDPDALFYLRSRGIGDHDAQAMLVAGFAAEVLERFPPGPIRQRADKLVGSHLHEVVEAGRREEQR